MFGIKTILHEEDAAAKAHQLGYKSKGYGYWEKDGKVVAKTVDGKLVPVDKKPDGVAPKGQNPTPSLKKPAAQNPALKPTGTSAAQAGKTIGNNTPQKSDVLKGKTDSEKEMEKRDKATAKQAEEQPQIKANPYRAMLPFGKPVDKLEAKKLLGDDPATADFLEDGVAGEDIVLMDEEEFNKFAYGENFEDSGLPPKPELQQKYLERARQQHAEFRGSLSEETQTQLLYTQMWWQAAPQFNRSQQERDTHNKFINQVCNGPVKPKTAIDYPIERGMVLPKDKLKDFLKGFRVGYDVDLPPSGFSASPALARGYCTNVRAGSPKAGVLVRLAPDTKGQIHGLHLGYPPVPDKVKQFDSRLAKDVYTFADEKEIIRPTGPKAQCVGIKKIIYKDRGKPMMMYVVELEEKGYDTPIKEGLKNETRNPVFDNIMNTAFGFWRPKKSQPNVPTPVLGEVRMPLREYDRAWRGIFRRINEAKTAAEQAHELGLHHVGWGYWADESGTVVAKTVNGILTKLEPDDELPPEGTSPDEWEKPARTAPAPTAKPTVPDKNHFQSPKEYVAALKKSLEDKAHKFEDILNGTHPVGIAKIGDEEKQASAAGLKVVQLPKFSVVGTDEGAVAKLADFFKSGGKYGSTEMMRLLGYPEDDVKEYVRYLKAIDRFDLLGKGTGNQFSHGGGKGGQGNLFSKDTYYGDHGFGGYSGGYTHKPYNPETEPHNKKETPVPEGAIRFLKGEPLPAELNGIPFAPWDAPKTPAEWANVEGTMPNLKEDPLPLSLKPMSAGVIIREPDGRVWVVEPKNHYMGYEHTFPKGKAEKELTLQQNAIKEAFEETGLKVQINGYFGDYDRDSSIGRYYTAVRVGGQPTDFGWETHSVKLVPPDKLPDLLNRDVDKRIGKDIAKGKFARATTAKEILAKKVGSQKGTNMGGFYEGTDGVLRYVKQYKDPSRCDCENLSNEVYRALGLKAPKSQVFDVNGQKAYASDIIDGKTLNHYKLDKKLAQDILDGFAADVLLSNWDTVGLENDNILLDDGGNPTRIDNGGTLLFRAMESSGRKPDAVLNNIPEWEGFANQKINPTYAAIFQAAGISKPEDLGWRLVDSVRDIARLRDRAGGWDKAVEHFAPTMKPEDKAKVVQMLNARTDIMVEKSKALEAQLKAKAAANKSKSPGSGERYEKGKWWKDFLGDD